jgi:hypothetical protein
MYWREDQHERSALALGVVCSMDTPGRLEDLQYGGPTISDRDSTSNVT